LPVDDTDQHYLINYPNYCSDRLCLTTMTMSMTTTRRRRRRMMMMTMSAKICKNIQNYTNRHKNVEHNGL